MRKLLVALVLVVVAGAVALVMTGNRIPDDVQPIAWNAEPCAHCHMIVGDPRYAVQLVTEDGAVLNFDDPGCALAFLAAQRPAIHRLWFHHGTRDVWLPADRVGFVFATPTPMSSNLMAVERETPGAIGFDEALRARAAKLEANMGAAP